MKSTFAVAAGLAVFADVSIAQLPPGITMDMVNTTLPEEGAPKAEPGVYAVTSEAASGATGLKVFRPADLTSFPQRDRLPIVVWGNGGCAVDAPRYAGFLETIASHGFLVITTTASAAANPAAPGAAGNAGPPPRRQATADDLKSAIDWAERENARAESPLHGKISSEQVAVMGQSCGGRLSILLGADARVDTIGVFNAGLGNSEMDAVKALHGPVLLINGHERDFMMAPARATFDAISDVPAFYGARHGAGHTATAYHAGGGEFANVAANWVRWHFKNDTEAAAMFTGAQCALCTDDQWDVAAKRIGE